MLWLCHVWMKTRMQWTQCLHFSQENAGKFSGLMAPGKASQIGLDPFLQSSSCNGNTITQNILELITFSTVAQLLLTAMNRPFTKKLLREQMKRLGPDFGLQDPSNLTIWLINISFSPLRIVTMDVILGFFSSSFGGDSLSMGNWERTNSPCCTPHFNKAGLGSCWIIIGGYMTQHFQRRDWHSSHSGWNFLSWHETCAGFSVQKEPQPAVWG